MTNLRNASPLASCRPLAALAVSFAMAFASIAPHHAEVERAGLPSRVAIAETAVHPGAPAHCEAARIEVHRGCSACLVQLGSSTVLGRPLVPLPAMPPTGDVAAPDAEPTSARPSLPGPARAPPAFSLACNWRHFVKKSLVPVVFDAFLSWLCLPRCAPNGDLVSSGIQQAL